MVACTVLTLGKLRQECRKLEGSLDYAVSSITILTTTTRPHLKNKRMVPIGFGGGDMVRAWEACNLCILGVVFLAAVTKKQMESSFRVYSSSQFLRTQSLMAEKAQWWESYITRWGPNVQPHEPVGDGSHSNHSTLAPRLVHFSQHGLW